MLGVLLREVEGLLGRRGGGHTRSLGGDCVGVGVVDHHARGRGLWPVGSQEEQVVGAASASSHPMTLRVEHGGRGRAGHTPRAPSSSAPREADSRASCTSQASLHCPLYREDPPPHLVLVEGLNRLFVDRLVLKLTKCIPELRRARSLAKVWVTRTRGNKDKRCAPLAVARRLVHDEVEAAQGPKGGEEAPDMILGPVAGQAAHKELVGGILLGSRLCDRDAREVEGRVGLDGPEHD